VMKYPKTDSGKFSLPGTLEVRVNEDGVSFFLKLVLWFFGSLVLLFFGFFFF